jgi:hypothetical protein
MTICTQEHLNFDNEIAALGEAIKLRKHDLSDLESMCTDAQLARDMSKVSKHSNLRGMLGYDATPLR